MAIVHMSKNGFLEDKELFESFKQKTFQIIHGNMEEIDLDLHEHIKIINQIDGLTTRFCCTGHSPSEGFHIVLAVNSQKAYDTLESIVHDYNRSLNLEDDLEEEVFASHLSIEKNSFLITFFNDNKVLYPVVTIKSFLGSIQEKEYLDKLYNAIRANVHYK